MKAASGDTNVHRNPATTLAARLPNACTPAKSPKAEPRRSVGALAATAALCAVSAKPMQSIDLAKADESRRVGAKTEARC